MHTHTHNVHRSPEMKTQASYGVNFLLMCTRPCKATLYFLKISKNSNISSRRWFSVGRLLHVLLRLICSTKRKTLASPSHVITDSSSVIYFSSEQGARIDPVQLPMLGKASKNEWIVLRILSKTEADCGTREKKPLMEWNLTKLLLFEIARIAALHWQIGSYILSQTADSMTSQNQVFSACCQGRSQSQSCINNAWFACMVTRGQKLLKTSWKSQMWCNYWLLRGGWIQNLSVNTCDL